MNNPWVFNFQSYHGDQKYRDPDGDNDGDGADDGSGPGGGNDGGPPSRPDDDRVEPGGANECSQQDSDTSRAYNRASHLP